jgi:hypothetical protein
LTCLLLLRESRWFLSHVQAWFGRRDIGAGKVIFMSGRLGIGLRSVLGIVGCLSIGRSEAGATTSTLGVGSPFMSVESVNRNAEKSVVKVDELTAKGEHGTAVLHDGAYN